MTKVLLFTNKNDVTTDFVVKELKRRSVDFYRFNTEELCNSVKIKMDFENGEYAITDSLAQQTHDILSFTDIYFRRPELPDYNDESLSFGERNFLKAEVFYTLEGIYKLLRDKHWFNSVFSIREAENKLYQLHLAKSIGLSIPKTILTNDYTAIRGFIKDKKCIIKPVHNARIMDSEHPQIVYTSEITKEITEKEAEYNPNYLQEKINKQCDVRATFVGDKCFAVAIDSQTNDDTLVDWRRGEHILKHTPIELPVQIESKCLQLMKALNLNFSAIDFVLDKNGNYIFLEINPNGQWAWIEHLTGMPISKEIVNQLCKYDI